MKRVIILDRDGVINVDSDEYIKSPSEFNPIPGSIEAIALLFQAGYTICIATNQSGIGRGLFTLRDLFMIHDKLLKMVTTAGGQISSIDFCPHVPNDFCKCRKPAPGLLLRIAERNNVATRDIVLVGDSLRDIQAAIAVGSKPILVKTGNGSATLADNHGILPPDILIFNDLLDTTHRFFLSKDY